MLANIVNIYFTFAELAVIETRQKEVPTEILKKAYDVLDGYKIDRSGMIKIVHDCK